ncbi:MAG: helix-turn-helix domain-containing protein [Acidobacteriota bacterium]|nr:helix-turn-helix domain-containing protein [Acidobacteriota bacterium]MDQ7088806.1 helix-turn-helix domain-containing protein [Acidobacteriota bacterium]
MVKESKQRLSRQRILRVARRHFGRYGYRRTSLAGIARELGVVKGALYYYVPGGKEELFDAVLAAEEQRLLTAMTRAVETQEDPRAALRAAVEAKLAALSQLRETLDIPREVGEEISALVQSRQRAFAQAERRLFESLLRRGEDAGIFRRIRPRRRAAEALQAMVRALELPMVFGTEDGPVSAIHILFEIIFRGLEER